MSWGGRRLTPLEEARKAAVNRLNKMYAYLSTEAGVERDMYGDYRRKYHSLIRPIEDREGQKQFLKKIKEANLLINLNET